MSACEICLYKLKAQKLIASGEVNVSTELAAACMNCTLRTLQNCLSEIKRRKNENKRRN